MSGELFPEMPFTSKDLPPTQNRTVYPTSLDEFWRTYPMIYERKYETESIYSDERASNDTEDADSSLKNSTEL